MLTGVSLPVCFSNASEQSAEIKETHRTTDSILSGLSTTSLCLHGISRQIINISELAADLLRIFTGSPDAEEIFQSKSLLRSCHVGWMVKIFTVVRLQGPVVQKL